MLNREELISQVVVTAQQMRDIEERIFAAGMPVAALMEKVAGLIANRIPKLIEQIQASPSSPLSPQRRDKSRLYKVGVLVGPGHNGGDALVVVRELFFRGYDVCVYSPFPKLKELTSQHFQYVQSLGIACYQSVEELQHCDLLIDGLFGFGLERNLTDPIASAIDTINQWSKPVISIDIPSGLHTDTGEVLGTAIHATYTLCLGLWKLGLLQDRALEYVGKAELIDFDISLSDVEAVLGAESKILRVTKAMAFSSLPLPRPAVTYKYKEGHLLLICGSSRYAGAAILTGLSARASGVGMLSIAVPESIKPIMISHLPEALIIGCPETDTGAIKKLQLPAKTELNSFSAIACGPGLTTDATPIVEQVLASNNPLLLDADGLNILAQMGTIPTLTKRSTLQKEKSLTKYPTIITPHSGEFKRLFPGVLDPDKDRIKAVREAAAESGAFILLKGSRTAIANPQGSVWIIPESTPALARGGSGDVLTGLLAGLLAQGAIKQIPFEKLITTAAWWHAQAGILAAQERTELGVDAFTLTHYLIRVISVLR